MDKKLNSQFQSAERLKKSIKNNIKKCSKIESEINQTKELLKSIAHFESSSNPKEKLQYLDTLRELKSLELTLSNTHILITCQIVELEKQIGKQNEFQIPTLGE